MPDPTDSKAGGTKGDEELVIKMEPSQVPEALRTAKHPDEVQKLSLVVNGKTVEMTLAEARVALQKGLAADEKFQAASAKEKEAAAAIAFHEDMRLWKEEGDPDAFRRAGAALGYAPDHVESLLAQTGAVENEEDDDDDEDVTKRHVRSRSEKPTEIGYDRLSPDVQRALKIVERDRIREIVDRELDKDEKVRYNMAKFDEKGRKAMRQLVDEKIKGRLAEVGGDFGDGTHILRVVIPEFREHLEALGIPDKTPTALSVGPSPGGGGQTVYPTERPEHVPSTEGAAFEQNILETMAWHMAQQDRGSK